jgi:penicillin-insensitive murein endopeptidase
VVLSSYPAAPLATLALTWLACTAPEPTAEAAGLPTPTGRAVARLDRAGVELLPRGLVDLDAATLAADPIPAFDRPHLEGLEAGLSYSIGTASRGYLVHGRRLPDDLPHLKPRPVSVARRAVWGTDALVMALDRSAAAVARSWPGSVLYAGDLSARHGGDLPGHASHNSGRDADLAFYMRDDAGMLADGPPMHPITDTGRALYSPLWFDAARNWALVAALLTEPEVQVQWIFVASHLEAMLLAHARASSADPKLIERAEAVLKEPVDSSRHLEHFHLRLFCALEERLEGCLDYGRRHPWIDTYAQALSRRVQELLPLLGTRRAEEGRYAIIRLVRLGAREAADLVAELADNPDPELGRLALDAAAFLRGERTPPEWAHLRDEDPGE